jgi:mannose-6-phosphate isomerase-like protein (cupin superfamily)
MDMPPTYWLFGTKLTIIQDETHTQNRYDLIEARFPLGSETCLHLHTAYDEVLYVLEGQFTVHLESGETRLAAGECLFVPRNASHVVTALGHSLNRALAIASPSGLARLIRTVGIPCLLEDITPIPANDMGLFLQLSHELGDMVLGSPGLAQG